MSESSQPELGEPAQAHVICVDDEIAVLKTFELIITHAGHRVKMFASPLQALAWMQLNADDIDLVITDQTMPEMSGIELADRLGELDSSIPVVLISGYTDVTEKSPRPNITLTLCKPVGYDALLRALEQSLSSRRVRKRTS